LDKIHSDEDQIIEKAISGDKEAFGYLYDHYFLQIFKYLLIRTDNQEDAEDMTETVFMKAWEHLPRFGGKKEERNFRAWLYRIAHNIVIDHYRTRKHFSPLETISQISTAEGEPDRIAVDNEDSRKIIEAIKRLDENSQKVIVSRFFGDLSHKETALSIGISENNVRVIQYRALKKIRDMLRKDNE